MKKLFFVLAYLVLLSVPVMAGGATLEELKADRTEKVKIFNDLSRRAAKLQADLKSMTEEATKVIGEVRYIDKLIKKYEEKPQDKVDTKEEVKK